MQLQELKKEFEKCRQELSRYYHLLERREHDLQKIHLLKESVEAKLIQMHQYLKKDAKKAEELKEQIAEETDHIADIKEAIKNIDEEIDQLGEEKEAHFELLKKKLTELIKNEFPESAPEYQHISAQIQEASQRKEQLLQQKNLMKPFVETLQKAAAINLNGNFFDFLFGKNPKSLLSRTLHTAKTQAEIITPQVEDAQLNSFLEKFLHEVQNPWNKELYRGKFTELYKEFSILRKELEQKNSEEQQKISEQEAALEKWMEKYSARAPNGESF